MIPCTTSNVDEFHLLLGLPRLYAADAKIMIRESIVKIRDFRRGEKVVKVEGLQFVEKESHKMILAQRMEGKINQLNIKRLVAKVQKAHFMTQIMSWMKV